jgi:hypothetical protein
MTVATDIHGIASWGASAQTARMTYTMDADPVRRKEQEMRASGLVGWALASDSFLSDDAIETFKRRGFSRYLPSHLTKASVDIVSTADTAIALMPLGTAFLGLVDAESVLGRLEGAVRLPYSVTGARLQVGTVTAVAVDEGAVRPAMALAFDTTGPPTKVEAQIVLSAEALRSFDPESQSGITRVLVSAVAAAVDRELVAVLTSAAPMAGTIGDLFAAVSGGQPSRPYLLAGYDMLFSLSAGTLRDLETLGVRVLPTPAAAGVFIALDASGLLIQDAGVEVQTARHATMTLDDGCGGGAVVSLWQNDLSCPRAEWLVRFTTRAGVVAWSGGTP